MEKISIRLKEAMKLRNFKPVDLVNKTKISKGAISSYLSGNYTPKSKNIYKIAKVLEVNPVWLLGYDVPMIEKEVIEIKENDKLKIPLNMGPFKANDELNIYNLILIISYFYSVMDEMKELFDNFIIIDDKREMMVNFYKDSDTILDFIALFYYLYNEIYEVPQESNSQTDLNAFNKLDYYTKITTDFKKLEKTSNISKEFKKELKHLNKKAQTFLNNYIQKERSTHGKILELNDFKTLNNQEDK